MKPIRKMSFLLLLAAVATVISTRIIPPAEFMPASENPLIKKIRDKMTAYSDRLPEERLYLQLDKPLYEPGDDIWFAGYLRDATGLMPSPVSDIMHVELINPRGGIENSLRLIARKGKVAGDFQLSPELPGGIYKIKAYTNWMMNGGESNCFVKEIQVQEVVLPKLKMSLDFMKKAYGAGDEVIARIRISTNENRPFSNAALRIVAQADGKKIAELKESTDAAGEAYIRFTLPAKLNTSDGLLNIMADYEGSTESISRSVPIVLNKLRLALYPEGGDLVEGIASRVAFSVVNEFGKPADVEGVVMSSKGTRVASFSSYHNGMGVFSIIPQPGEKYYAKITKPENTGETFALPEPAGSGYVMTVNAPQKDALEVEVNTTETGELSLLAQVRGRVYYAAALPVLEGSSKFRFSTAEFPAGVAQVTLFDAKGIARAERLVFVNKHRQLNISVQPEKEKYLPREKVRLNITVRDERGLPAPAHLSMAVVNDQLLSFADDRSGNLVSQLLLQQDIKGKVEEPAFYFDPREPKADRALDYLLMTSGWRRFSWEALLEQDPPAITHEAEKAIIGGRVLNGHTQLPLAGVKLKDGSGGLWTTDHEGRFTITGADLTRAVTLQLQAEGFYAQTLPVNSYGEDLVVYLYNQQYRHLKRASAVPMMAMENGMAFEAAVPAEDVLFPAPHQAQKAAIKRPGAQEVNKKEKQEGDRLVKDRRDVMFGERKQAAPHDGRVAGTVYYRARQFATPVYSEKTEITHRSDFRNTIYWNPDIEVGYSGKKTIEFYASDDITSFRAVTEGIGKDGMTGRNERTFFTQLPFQLSVKMPVELVTGDVISLPVTLRNNTGAPIGGVLSVGVPAGFSPLQPSDSVQTLMPGASRTIFLSYKVGQETTDGSLSVAYRSCGLSDGFTGSFRVIPRGFPVKESFSAQDADREYTFGISNLVKGSLKVTVTAYPNVVADLLSGVEGILSEPYGCFEQTSCTAYPNAMVLSYLKHTGSNDTRLLAHAGGLLDRGYKRLVSFESPGRGYEWFGANPAHEGLTAYGIMEFVDMQKAGQQIDEKMLERTAQWLLSHRDGKGGFERERRALHDFGRISDEVLNGYIVYALSEAGYSGTGRELEATAETAVRSRDPYLLAMSASALYLQKQHSKANSALALLLDQQRADGSFEGSTHSITYSQGSSLTIETTALAILAMLKAPEVNNAALSKAVRYLVGTRSGSGVFSSTQGTILALKALTEFAKFSKRTADAGTMIVYIDGRKAAEKSYAAGEQGSIVLDGLGKFVKGEGKHTLRVRFEGTKTALPYTAGISWNTTLPASDSDCALDLKTSVSSPEVKVGETCRLKVMLSNRRESDVPSAVALIGIPAGFSAQPWQLKEMQEKRVFDYYEIKGNNVALYYRGIEARSSKEINLDLKAEISGIYEAPASVAYLYYTNEFRSWAAGSSITVKN